MDKRLPTAMAAASALTLTLGIPLASASVRPVAASSSGLPCHASMTNYHPRDYTSTGVKVRTAPYADIETAAHYKTTTHRKYATAGSTGRWTIWYYISGATPGYKVVVKVHVRKGSEKRTCSMWFTPRA